MAFDNLDYDYDEGDPLEFEDPGYEQLPPAPQQSGGGGGFDFSGIISTITENPLYVGIAAGVLGLLIGLIFAYVIWPVQYTDAAPEHLHPNYQLDYMRMVVDSYNLRQDNALATKRISALGDDSAAALQALIDNPGDDLVSQQGVQLFLDQYQPDTSAMTTDDSADTDTDTEGQAAEGEDAAAGEEEEKKPTSSWLLLACAVTLGLAAVLVAFYFIRIRNRQPMGKTAQARADEFSVQAQQTDYEARGENPPIAQWMTTYLIGDDLYDDSFSIDSMNGEFLGECGVGIADTIGVGEPKRVSAFEVWLFDKNDIQTVTNVLVSAHSFSDDNTLNRLKAKGDPYPAEPGEEIELVTKTLRMVVRVMDMDYGSGHLPEGSFFQRMTLELAVWHL